MKSFAAGPPAKRIARTDPGEFVEATTDKQNNRGHRPVLQGLTTDRNACQPAPTYERPPGADTLDELERLWNSRRRS